MSTMALSEIELKDRLLGAAFGACLGSAYGLQAEGGTPAAMADRRLEFPLKTPVKGFPLNDWGAPGDQLVLVMRTFTSHRRHGVISPSSDFAGRLVKWIQGGFPELGDTAGQGCGEFTRRVAAQERFVDEPFEAAEKLADPKSGNGAVIRALPCAFMPESPDWAEFISRVTHPGPQCAAVCVAQAMMIRVAAEWKPAAVFPMEAFRKALAAGLAQLGTDAGARDEYLSWARASKHLYGLGLHAPASSGYVYFAFACGVWVMRMLRTAMVQGAKRDGDLFRGLLETVAKAGGDAGTNCATVGAIAGAAIGYDKLPKEWVVALPFRNFLEREVGFFLSTL